MQQGVQTDEICNIQKAMLGVVCQQCCDRLHWISGNSSASEAELKFEEKTEKPFEV